MITFWRILLAGSRNFLRNLWLSTAATAVMSITLVVVLASFATSMALNGTIKGIVDKIDVSLYLKDMPQAQAQQFADQISHLDNVASVKYVSKDEALAIYKKQVANDPKLENAVTASDNPLPASLQVKAKDPNKLDPIIQFVSQPQYAQLLSAPPTYSGERKVAIDHIVGVSNFLKKTGLIASIMFIFISVLIIFNTIRMAIFTRRGEIEIMKLVGATPWFIRGPFIFEASLYGIIAAFIAVILVVGAVLSGGPSLSKYIDISQTVAFFRDHTLLIVLGEVLIGVFIGAVSSLLAMARYLKL